MKTSLLFFFSLFGLAACTAQWHVEACDTGLFMRDAGVNLAATSFRGLSVVDDKVVWVSGSRGTVGMSKDGGRSFHMMQLKGYERSDFRDIEAFDDQYAVIMSSGTPAYILVTGNGGKSWKEAYISTDSAVFLDAMDFSDRRHGIIVGDPINRRFLLLRTSDGGKSWTRLDASSCPQAMRNEAVFAASGTSLRYTNKKDVAFVSGGSSSFLYTSTDGGQTWQNSDNALSAGAPFRGTFSFYKEPGCVIYAGGDYRRPEKLFDKQTPENEVPLHARLNAIGVILSPGTSHREKPGVLNETYISCVEKIGPDTFVACSPVHVYISTDPSQAYSFKPVADMGFHVVRKAKKGNAVFFAGSNGRIGWLLRTTPVNRQN